MSVCFFQRERQANREDALELTEKLDQDWREIQTLLSHKIPKSEKREQKEKPKVGTKGLITAVNLTSSILFFFGEETQARMPLRPSSVRTGFQVHTSAASPDVQCLSAEVLWVEMLGLGPPCPTSVTLMFVLNTHF